MSENREKSIKFHRKINWCSVLKARKTIQLPEKIILLMEIKTKHKNLIIIAFHTND